MELRAPPVGEKSPEKKAEEAAVRKEAENIERVLDGIGYGKRQAREMVARALAQLATLGRPPTGEEILNTALHGRVVVKKSPPSAIADNHKPSGSADDPRGGHRPPAGGEAGAGPEGGNRIAS